MTDAEVIVELQTGIRLLKQERYKLLEKNEKLDKFYSQCNTERIELQVEVDKIKTQAEQIKILKDIIIEFQMAKLCWCDRCGRDGKKERARLLKELDALVIVKELQNGKSKTDDL